MENVYKLNIDGALFFDINDAGIGAILRDSNGNTVMEVRKKERDLLQPTLVESLAILRGLQFCLQMGLSNLLVEFDCQSVVAELQGD